MAAISLRDYIREIEKQVEGGRNEEAIAHSRHILESFPKHVDVYRLLGKAYLESQRYGDAGDILQRVLSAVPEDFVAHVGMSIIREDEGNLDEAIWHMERAFDVQPSNSAIQDELRRLYGRRDNIEPPKIRLTRGALARMYFKGELYPQAIAEVRAALNENPDRLDLQLLLAETYARTGQRAEAVDMAGQVLRKLPFCLAANQIMVEMLIGTDQEGEIQTYFQRLSQLDPYAAYITVAAPRVENVPDKAIRLNKLDYKVSQAVTDAPSQPLWAATLGVEVDEIASDQEETLPEWLSTSLPELDKEGELAEDTTVPAVSGDESQAVSEEQVVMPGAAAEEEQIPDWMKELGWAPASDKTREAEAPMESQEESSTLEEEGELAPAEIPEWLKALAPSDALPGADEEEAKKSFEETLSETLDWQDVGLVLGAAAVGAAALDQEEEIPPGAETSGEEATLPEEVIDELMVEGPSAEVVPDWLLESKEMASEESIQEPGEPVAEQFQDWLTETTPAEELPGEEKAEEFPDWLVEAQEPQAQPVTDEAQPVEEPTEVSFEEAALGEAVDAEMEAEELPDWLIESETTPGEAASVEEVAEMEEELPSWLLESEAAPGEEIPTETPAETSEELPRWLFEAAAVEGTETTIEEPAEEAEEAEGIPDWLKAAGAVAGAAGAFEAFEWLSGEEGEEGAAEQEPSLEGEIETTEALLDQEMAEEPQELMEAVEQVVLEEEMVEAVQPLAEAEPAVFGDTQPTRVQTTVEAPVINRELEEAFAWLDSMLTPVKEAVEVAEPQTPTEMEPTTQQGTSSTEIPVDDDAAFAWLEGLAVRQGAQDALLLKPEERLETPPEWVQKAAEEVGEPPQTDTSEIIEEKPVAEPEAGAAPAAQGPEAATSEDADFAWLESLAVRQGAQEALLLKPEERREAPPDWLKAAAAAEAADIALDRITEEETTQEQEVEATPMEVFPEAEEGAVEPTAPIPPAATVEEPPELPDWLAEPGSETREETMEWTPPPVSRRKYDVNKITLSELERLPGIGFIMAQRVIEYRNTRGPFKKIDDLLNVPEFSVATLEGIRENLYLEARPEPTPATGPIPTRPRPDSAPLVLATGAGLPEEVGKARQYLSEGLLGEALDKYDAMIHSKLHLSWVIEDLREASNQYPSEFYVWQSLGDAYLRSDLASQALQAFIRAEKLLLL